MALAVAVLIFSAFSEPIYSNCHNGAEGYTCDLVGYKMGR